MTNIQNPTVRHINIDLPTRVSTLGALSHVGSRLLTGKLNPQNAHLIIHGRHQDHCPRRMVLSAIEAYEKADHLGCDDSREAILRLDPDYFFTAAEEVVLGSIPVKPWNPRWDMKVLDTLEGIGKLLERINPEDRAGLELELPVNARHIVDYPGLAEDVVGKYGPALNSSYGLKNNHGLRLNYPQIGSGLDLILNKPCLKTRH